MLLPIAAAAAMASRTTGAGAPAQSPGQASGAVSGQASDPRLKPAAHEFEACLMKEFIQPLQHDALFDDKSDSNSGEGSDSALMSFGSEALAKAISERGGFGIATKIIGGLKQGASAGNSERFLRTGRKT